MPTQTRYPNPTPAHPVRGAALALCLALLAACGGSNAPQAQLPHPDTAAYRNIAADRLPLLQSLHSYDDEALIQQALQAAGLTAKRQALSKPPSGRYPPRELVSLTVENFQHWGEEGVLRLELFNNRLMEAEFRPKDAARFATALRRNLPKLPRGATGTSELIEGNLRVYSNVEFAKSGVGGNLATKPLVLWQDLRLIRQRDDWDARFGSIPVPASP